MGGTLSCCCTVAPTNVIEEPHDSLYNDQVITYDSLSAEKHPYLVDIPLDDE